MNDLQFGAKLGSYTIERALSSGGMGSLYLATDLSGNHVVIKFPHTSMLGDPALYERYRRELEIGRILHHPNIQNVLATGDIDGQPFMVTEYIEGDSLREYLSTHAPLPLDEAVHLLDGLCNGVTYCHEHGVFHRDLKPENILLRNGEPIIIDFGIALLRGARRVTWSGLSGAVGTPDYMAPEQIQGKRGDARTDIYALGAMGYEFLTGQPPFSGDNPLAVMSQHLHGELTPPRTLVPTIPLGLDAVIVKSLQRDPDQRYQTVEEFRQAILNYASIVPTPALQQQPHHTPEENVRRAERRQAIILTLVIIGILVGIVALGIIAQILHGHH